MSQSDDLDAINTYMSTTPLVTSKATALHDDWVTWWNGLGFYDKSLDSNTYNIARNKRNAFNLANVTTAAEHAAVQQVVTHGVTTEQQQGLPDPRKADGTFYVAPKPLIPTEYKTVALVAGVLFGGLFAYGLSQSLPKALLSRGARPSAEPSRGSSHFAALKKRLGV